MAQSPLGDRQPCPRHSPRAWGPCCVFYSLSLWNVVLASLWPQQLASLFSEVPGPQWSCQWLDLPSLRLCCLAWSCAGRALTVSSPCARPTGFFTCSHASQEALAELLGETQVHTTPAAGPLSLLVQNSTNVMLMQSFFFFFFWPLFPLSHFSDPDYKPIKRKFYQMMLLKKFLMATLYLLVLKNKQKRLLRKLLRLFEWHFSFCRLQPLLKQIFIFFFWGLMWKSH